MTTARLQVPNPVLWASDRWDRFLAWRRERARFLFQLGPRPFRPWYVRITPSLECGTGWPARYMRWARIRNEALIWKGVKLLPRRLVFSWHNGLQIVRWVEHPERGVKRWEVERQLLGRDRTIHRKEAGPWHREM